MKLFSTLLIISLICLAGCEEHRSNHDVIVSKSKINRNGHDEYRFTVRNGSYEHEVSVSKEEWQRCLTGDQWSGTYWSPSPEARAELEAKQRKEQADLDALMDDDNYAMLTEDFIKEFKKMNQEHRREALNAILDAVDKEYWERVEKHYGPSSKTEKPKSNLPVIDLPEHILPLPNDSHPKTIYRTPQPQEL